MCQWFTEGHGKMIACDCPPVLLLVIRTPFDVYSVDVCEPCAEDVKRDPLNEILYEVGLAIPYQGEPVTQSENSTIGNSNGL